VVQGERDPFGMPPPGRARTVVSVPGNHSLRSTASIEAAVTDWLADQFRPQRHNMGRQEVR
jgi:hypothetical protein